jgi:hypothetical protein
MLLISPSFDGVSRLLAVAQGVPPSQASPQPATPPAESPATNPPNSQQNPVTPPQSSSAARKKKLSNSAANNTPRKKVISNGSTTEPDLEIAPNDTAKRPTGAQNTNNFLANAGANLKKLSGRQLSSDQQATVTQIKNYMAQSKQASEEGDAQRAYNLAHKANLLSTELLRH